MRELTLLHVHGDNIGYARLGSCLYAALGRRGIEMYDSLGEGPGWSGLPEEVERAVAAKHGVDPVLQREAAVGKTNTVAWVATPSHARWWWEGQHAALFSMWEARRLPEGFREQLHEFETVIVPSTQNQELFSQYHDDVQTCWLGVDPKVWHFTPRQPPTTRFNFLIGGSGKRKGTDLAYAAFLKVFGDWKGDGPEPHLVMKNPRQEDYAGPRISMLGGRLTSEQEVACYEEAHCYLQPSRGEGFGLQPLQAIAQGIPTILTADHGHASYADLGIPISSVPAKSEYFIYGDAGEWWEPNFDELCAAMRDVYDNYDHHLALASMAAGVVSQEFTWDKSAERFEKILGDRLTVPYSGGGGWYIPERKLYEVITSKDWTCDIGGTLYHFAKGVPQHAPADVKRVLFESNVLDVACINTDNSEDTGLLPRQLEAAQKDDAKRRACSKCGTVQGRSYGDELVDRLEALAPWQNLVARVFDDGITPELMAEYDRLQNTV